MGGLPGVNLSEHGNARWKPSATMHLVKAAKYDVATMLLQEKELFKFNQNLGTSSGKGPSQAVRDAKDRKKQLQKAEDFVNILDDEEAILLEAQQANNPTTFIPKAVERHRAKEDGLGIHVCKGCPKGIQKDEQKYPRYMVFWHKGIVGYYNRVLNKWIQQESNIHVHLSMQCLCKHDQTVEMRNIYMNDKVWQNLTRSRCKY